MNPVALVVALIAVALIVIGFRGHQDNLIAAFLGRPWGKSTLQ